MTLIGRGFRVTALNPGPWLPAGHVSLDVIKVYIRAMGGMPSFLLLAAWYLMCESARVGATVWLSHWTGVADQPGVLAIRGFRSQD